MSFYSCMPARQALFVIPIFVILLLLLTFYTNGQIPFKVKQKKIDSLFTRLKTSQDTAYVNTLNNLSLNLADRYFDSAYRYAQQALAWARYYHYPKGEGIAYLNTGNCYFVKMDLKSALNQYFKALQILEPLGPSVDLVNLYYQMASINSLVPENQQAIDYFQKVMETSLIAGDTLFGVIDAYLELSMYYWQCWLASANPDSTQFLQKAEHFINRAFELLPYDTIRNLNKLIDCLTIKGQNLGCRGKKEAYEPYSQALHFALKMKQTRAYSQSWIEMFDTTNAEWFIGFCFLNMGGYYLDIADDLQRAEKYYKESLNVLKNGPYIEIMAVSLGVLGYISMKQAKYDLAIYYYKECIAYCDTFLTCIDRRNHLPSWTRLRNMFVTKAYKVSFTRDLANVYKITGDYQKALDSWQLAEEENNELKMDDFRIKIDLLQSTFDNDRSSNQIGALLKQNELNKTKLFQIRALLFGTAIVVALFVFMLIFYFQRNRLRTKQKSLMLEQKLLRSQMNPHFIFNSLSSIQNFIVTEKPDKASLYLSKFSRLVRNILDNSVEEFVVLEKEINTIKNYLELQKVRYTGKFDYRIHIADNIDSETMKIPPMLAQPFIENAIEHGIKNRETPGHIDIRFNLKDNLLVFEVEDDGIGRQKAREIMIHKDPEHRSMATSITIERIANLNRKLREKIKIEIIDLKNAPGEATGTMVRFAIPV